MNAPKYKCHLFICTHNKDKGASCGPKGAADLRHSLKKKMEEKYPHRRHDFRVNASGCLGQCEKGISAVAYPMGQWKTELTSADLSPLEDWMDQLLGETSGQ